MRRFIRAFKRFLTRVYSWKGKTLRNSLKSFLLMLSIKMAKRPTLISPGSRTNAWGSSDWSYSSVILFTCLYSSTELLSFVSRKVSLRTSGFPIYRMLCGSSSNNNFFDSAMKPYFCFNYLRFPPSAFIYAISCLKVWICRATSSGVKAKLITGSNPACLNSFLKHCFTTFVSCFYL